MNAAGALLLEAAGLLRSASSACARKTAAREAAQLDIAELTTGPEDLSHTLIAIRAVITAIALAAEPRRVHLVTALQALIDAARTEGRVSVPGHSRERPAAALWWLRNER